MKNEVKVLCPACDGRGHFYRHDLEDAWSEDCETCKGKGHKVRKAVVGDAATIQVGSDRYAATVIWVSPSGHQIKLQRDKTVATKPTAHTEDQSYICVEDKDGEVEKAAIRLVNDQESHVRAKECAYFMCGRGYQHVTIGIKRPYRDPSF